MDYEDGKRCKHSDLRPFLLSAYDQCVECRSLVGRSARPKGLDPMAHPADLPRRYELLERQMAEAIVPRSIAPGWCMSPKRVARKRGMRRYHRVRPPYGEWPEGTERLFGMSVVAERPKSAVRTKVVRRTVVRPTKGLVILDYARERLTAGVIRMADVD